MKRKMTFNGAIILDKIQKFLGTPDRISTIWFLLTMPFTYVFVLVYPCLSSSSWIKKIIMGIVLLNGTFLLKYTRVIKRNTAIILTFFIIILVSLNILLYIWFWTSIIIEQILSSLFFSHISHIIKRKGDKYHEWRKDHWRFRTQIGSP